jgi:hypothetical protein
VSFLVEVILRPILEFLLHVIAHWVGCLVVRAISFGRWRCDPREREVPKKKLRGLGFHHIHGGRVYVTAVATSLIGLLFLALVIGLMLWWHLRA